MGILINQGKQDASQDKEFGVITSARELAQVTKLAITDKGLLEVTMKIIGEGSKFKNRLIWDRVDFNPDSTVAWKYRAFRKACGEPYSASEATSIDIEALVLNKALEVKLKPRIYNDQEYQQVEYIAAKTVGTEADPQPITIEDDAEDVVWDN